MLKLFQGWFNPFPFINCPFILDPQGKKVWVVWDESDPPSFLWLIQSQKIVGQARFLWHDNHLELTYMSVEDPKLRKKGVGCGLMKEIKEKAIQLGKLSIQGYIAPDETTSFEYLVYWYRRQDFIVDENTGFIELRLP